MGNTAIHPVRQIWEGAGFDYPSFRFVMEELATKTKYLQFVDPPNQKC